MSYTPGSDSITAESILQLIPKKLLLLQESLQIQVCKNTISRSLDASDIYYKPKNISSGSQTEINFLMTFFAIELP